MKIIECVPNFSEGNNLDIIDSIKNITNSFKDITLLDVDPGKATNRTVITFAGSPNAVIECAFEMIKIAAELIDMKSHKGEHPRMGATDVCPLIPISGVTIEECIGYSIKLSKKVGSLLRIPVFLYEYSSNQKYRKNLADIRSGEYEGMEIKMQNKKWHPDFGPNIFNKKAGCTAIGVRDFLIAYNINLNTRDKSIATDIALDIREAGRNKRDSKGKFIRDRKGIPIKKPGKFKNVKAVGWFIKEYGIAQISINLTDYTSTPLFKVFEEVRRQANKRGVRVTGSEIVGLIPKECIVEVGKYYLKKQKRSTGLTEDIIIDIAIKSLGLEDLSKFDRNKKIIELCLNETKSNLLKNKPIEAFLNILSIDTPTPGGGSVAALCGSLGACLNSMVANLTIGKKKWFDVYDKMCEISEESQILNQSLMDLIDKDSKSFELVMDAFKISSDEKDRDKKIMNAYKNAVKIPLETLLLCLKTIKISSKIIKIGNENAISDAAVAAEVASAGAYSANYNIKINLSEINDDSFCKSTTNKSIKLLNDVDTYLKIVRIYINNKFNE